MNNADLFQSELATLEQALWIQGRNNASAAEYRDALGTLIVEFQRLMRETSRLIRHSDRAELETNRLNRQLQELAAQLEYRATHDALTGILNRAAIIERGTRLLADEAVALIVFDIDFFKRINDAHGHPAGDMVLRDLVACLGPVVTDGEHIGRVGGEEFTVLLPGHGAAQACALAEHIRACIERHPFAAPVGRSVTVSLGVSWNVAGSSFDAAYGRADEALYRAKRAGRNRVECAEEPPCGQHRQTSPNPPSPNPPFADS
ncbi:GGDEF domain-containing protein [Pseudothauera nasutitermitis]|uniref:diguanylate cyclase n=1 Tax=Pseudothauera nasutitermitis TaxID=2565930 RepID=A0A4S4B7A9_9RHOO|nr:GGDEF domain-containing protein [Pseudothauera nasutitermitis]THF66893.1 GGDEF domain-containing protein [Pseudothauera nasutitermitis]